MPADEARGRAVVMQPGQGLSYWQSVPADGHADPALFPANTSFKGLPIGSRLDGGRVNTRRD